MEMMRRVAVACFLLFGGPLVACKGQCVPAPPTSRWPEGKGLDLKSPSHPQAALLSARCDQLAKQCYEQRNLKALATFEWKGLPQSSLEPAHVKAWRGNLPFKTARADSIDFVDPFARVLWVEYPFDANGSPDAYCIYWLWDGTDWKVLSGPFDRQWPHTWRYMLGSFLVKLLFAYDQEIARYPLAPLEIVKVARLFDEACREAGFLVPQLYAELLYFPIEEIRVLARERLAWRFGEEFERDTKERPNAASAERWRLWLGEKFGNMQPFEEGYAQVTWDR